jgi:ABC-type uncharacterized transport system substrate-binding protein
MKRNWQIAALGIMFIFTLSVVIPAMAHPDILMKCRLLFNFQGDMITALGESWVFGEAFSEQMLADYDLDHDGDFNDSENVALAKKILPILASERHYTSISINGQDIAAVTPLNFRASARNKIVTFTFGVQLPAPVDPVNSVIRIQIKDPKFSVYVASPKQDSVILRGMPPDRCKPQVTELDTRFGGIEVTLLCHK